MTILDPYTVVVSNENELRSAITEVNTYNYIYFDNNITLTSGIQIPLSKKNLTIDGTYKDIRYTYTDMNSPTATNSIYVSVTDTSRPIINLTMKNMDIIGRNYYGAICVIDSLNAENTTTRYENVNYTGCQITYNNYGITEYINSTINVNNTTTTRDGEVGEVHKLVIGGNTTINHSFTGYNTFYFRNSNNASFTILPDANVNITCGRNLFAGDVQLESMTFGANSTCNIITPNGLSLAISDRVRNVLVDTNATLNISRLTGTGVPTLYVENSFKVNSGANVLIKSASSNSNPHLYFYTTNAILDIDNPASCIFYNTGAPNFYFTGTSRISLKSNQINQWNTAVAVGNINNLPTYQWIKKDRSVIEFTGTATNTTTTISSNNLDPVADVKLPNVSSLQLRTARVLSLGYLPLLNVKRIISTATSIFGTTVPDAGLKIDYKGITTYGAADGSGKFDVGISTPLIIDEYVKVMNSNNDFLYNIVDVIIEEPGELTLYLVPDTMVFSCNNLISTSPLLFGREIDNWTLQVFDSRVYSSDWTLTATIERDLKCEADGRTLPNSLVYVKDVAPTILSSTPTLVFTGADNEGVTKITDVNWPANQGILLKIDTVPIYKGDLYTTPITWTLHE